MDFTKDALLLVLFGGYVLLFTGLFLTSSGTLFTLVVGINVGVGATGAFLSALKLIRPEKYRFRYESRPGHDAGNRAD